MKKQKAHYAWVMAFVGFMIFAINFCIIFNSIGLYVKPVTESLGILRRDYALNNTVTSLAMMVMSLLSGKIYAKFKLKTVLLFGAVLCPISYACYGLANTKTEFFIISLFLGIGIACNGMIPVSMLMTNWFEEKRGFAIGLAFTGSGVGGVVLTPILASIIKNFGWRYSFLVSGVLMALLVLPLVLFLVKSTPSEKGCIAYGQEKSLSEKPIELSGIMANQAIKKAKFWLFLPIPLFISIMSCSIIQLTVPFIEELGHSSGKAATWGTVMLLSLAFGKIFLGKVYDLKGVKFTTYSALTLLFVALACYSLGNINILLYTGIILSGYGSAMSSVSYPIVTQNLFGKKDYAAIYGYISVFSSLGTAIGPMTVSAIYDAIGSYNKAWIVLSTMCIVTLMVYFLLNKINKIEYK